MESNDADDIASDVYDYQYDYYGIEACPDDLVEMVATEVIYSYVSPVLLFLGSFGNLFSFVVMYRFSFQVLSTCIYFCLLSVVDLLVLYTRCGNEWFTRITHFDLSTTLMVSSESVCKVYPFVFNFIFHLSKWLMVCLAIEGFIATRYPEKSDRMCNLSRAKAIVLFLTVILVCVNIHYFWSFELIFIRGLDDQFLYFCTFAKDDHQQSEFFQATIWPILDTLIAAILPCCIVLLCGIIMFVQIVKGKHLGNQEHQKWKQRYKLHAGAMDELQITILVVCICFLALTFPKFIYEVLRYKLNWNASTEFSCQLDAQYMLANAVCGALEYLFLSGKFLVYFCTSGQFRAECRKIMSGCFSCCVWCVRHRRTVHPDADGEAESDPLEVKSPAGHGKQGNVTTTTTTSTEDIT